MDLFLSKLFYFFYFKFLESHMCSCCSRGENVLKGRLQTPIILLCLQSSPSQPLRRRSLLLEWIWIATSQTKLIITFTREEPLRWRSCVFICVQSDMSGKINQIFKKYFLAFNKIQSCSKALYFAFTEFHVMEWIPTHMQYYISSLIALFVHCGVWSIGIEFWITW